MLVKIKQQSALSASPLNSDNNIKRAYISRSGLEQVFDVSTTTLTFELYSFDSINDVKIEVASTSKVVHTVTNATSGNYVVTAEDGSIKTYGYTITAKSYVNGLPIITSASSTSGTAKILKQVNNQSVLGQVWNIGEIVRRDTNQINAVTVQDGSWKLMDVQTDYDATELSALYNGTDKYIKVWRNVDNATTNYHKFVYYRIVENSNLFPSNPTVTPTKKEYENQVGYWNFDVFIPYVDTLSVENIYNKASKTDLVTYLTTNNVKHYTPVTWTEVDSSWNVTSFDTNWNNHSDKGFKQDDVLNMNKTFAKKIQDVISRTFEPSWTTYKATQTYTNTEAEIVAKQRYRATWLQTNNLDGVYEWMDYILLGESGIQEDSIKGTTKTVYIANLKGKFATQFTYGWLVKNLNENDVQFFKNRITYLQSILSAYKSDLSVSDVQGILNVFVTLESVIKLNRTNGQQASTTNMNVSIKKLTDKAHVMKLTSAFA